MLGLCRVLSEASLPLGNHQKRVMALFAEHTENRLTSSKFPALWTGDTALFYDTDFRISFYHIRIHHARLIMWLSAIDGNLPPLY